MNLADGGLAFDLSSLADAESLPWLGEGEDLMRILHVDEGLRQVIFIQCMSQNVVHAYHTHHCTAIAYTLSGCWHYADDRFPEGTLVFEPPGTSHNPETRDDNRAVVLVILTAGAGNERLLELETPDGKIELDVQAFRRMKAMKSNEEWPEFARELRGSQA